MQNVMKLSEAIRLGSMLRPQTFEYMVDSIGTCAFGAAKEAIGVSIADGPTVINIWPWVANSIDCPVCGYSNRVEVIIAMCLNDNHRWNRERIAEWVATVELKDEPIMAVEVVQELVAQ